MLSKRSEFKEILVLLVFDGFLSETLTWSTLLFMLAGCISVWLYMKPGKTLRTIITLGLFATYWITYGKVIDPEVGLNFLTSIIVLKLLEKETERDRYMLFFGMMLLISAGSLFQKSLGYVFFFAVSFFVLIHDFYQFLRLPLKLKELFQSLMWVLPFTAFLFFFVPRLMNPFQLEKGGPQEGEIGYTPDVNISQIEQLVGNDRPVFQAKVDAPIAPDRLYWRGNILTFTDGWNWPLMPQDRPQILFDPLIKINPQGLRQKMRMFSQQEFFFGLDHPQSVVTPKGSAVLDATRTLTQLRWLPYARYEVLSSEGVIASNPPEKYPSGLKKQEKEWIAENFSSVSATDLRNEIQKYFQDHAFSYSLTPGRVNNFLDFMQNKKIGFCSHYASAVAQIMRAKNIPVRLVSGFQGGNYNKFAGFYLVTQNDAHVWVEAFENGKWLRMDPTEWIAPDRVRLGGNAFIQEVGSNTFSAKNFFGKRFSLLNDFSQWMGQWDFKFYTWLEEMDYYTQEALLEKFHFKREWIFSSLPFMLAIFIGLYTWTLSRKKIMVSELEELWLQFGEKLKSRGIPFPFHSVAEGESILKSQELVLQKIWLDLVEVSFQQDNSLKALELKRRIKRL